MNMYQQLECLGIVSNLTDLPSLAALAKMSRAVGEETWCCIFRFFAGLLLGAKKARIDMGEEG